MKKGLFIIGILLILTFFKSLAQENSDASFKYYFNQLDGLKDKSDLVITKTKTDSICEFNVVGTVVYEREIGKDSVEYVPSFAYLIMTNKADTVETSLSENFKIKISEGKYQWIFQEMGLVLLQRQLELRKMFYTHFM